MEVVSLLAESSGSKPWIAVPIGIVAFGLVYSKTRHTRGTAGKTDQSKDDLEDA